MTWRVLLLPLLLLLGPSSAAQPKHYTWPRQAHTDSIVFRGVLAWPAEAGTAAERQALVQQWYRTRLTQTQPLLSQWPVPQARTYAGLPAGGYQDLQLVGEVCRLTYRVALSPTPAGVACRLWAFNYTRAGFDASGTSELEDYLRVAPGPHPELDRMQHRLRVALAHW